MSRGISGRLKLKTSRAVVAVVVNLSLGILSTIAAVLIIRGQL
jgi:hypothetical protein